MEKYDWIYWRRKCSLNQKKKVFEDMALIPNRIDLRVDRLYFRLEISGSNDIEKFVGTQSYTTIAMECRIRRSS